MYMFIRSVLFALTIITALFAFGVFSIPARSIATMLFLAFLFLEGVSWFSGPHHITLHRPHWWHRPR
jgi:hypothetical protein